MLDQSFSYENFRILLDVENRKGRYLEDKMFFESDMLLAALYKKLKQKNKVLR